MNEARRKALELIERNIEKSGYHVYVVSGAPSPRFAYTIGLRESLGAELVLAGAYFYEETDEVLEIIGSIRKQLAKGNKKLGPVWLSTFAVAKLGSFTLRKVHASWARSLLLGVLDYYDVEDVDAYQIVPEENHRTIDVPNMTNERSAANAPAWSDDWPYPVSAESEVMTHLAVLRGAPVTEAARWEDDYWEMFAGSSADVVKSEGRLVPLGCLLAHDPSLVAVVELAVGNGLWRDEGGAWNRMTKD